MPETAASAWLTKLRPSAECRLRLFCFPYAGGSSAAFRAWPARLPSEVEIYSLSLPGRGSRIREAPLARVSSLVEGAAPAIRPHLDRPFAFFGHSMGALVGFELARHLRRVEGIEPAHLFVSGCRAPQMPDTKPPFHKLPDSELTERLRELNGTPPEVLGHPELMRMLLPILRADFEAAETYSYEAAPPLGCPISAYGGLLDSEVERAHLEAWREQTTGGFAVEMFDGGHFFIHEAEPSLLRALARELLRLIGRGA